MKLYYSQGACSLAPHILLEESGLAYTAQQIVFDNGDGETAAFKKLSPFGYIPILELEDGKVLTEGVAIQLYIADQVPEMNMAPRAGTFERAKLHEWMTLISSEIHKGLGSLFAVKSFVKTDAAAEELKAGFTESVGKKLDILNGLMANKKFVMGDQFTTADAYLFTVFSWTNYLGMKMTAWPNIAAHYKMMMERPAVRRAMAAEDLLD